jgi:hypothetical protein
MYSLSEKIPKRRRKELFCDNGVMSTCVENHSRGREFAGAVGVVVIYDSKYDVRTDNRQVALTEPCS